MKPKLKYLVILLAIFCLFPVSSVFAGIFGNSVATIPDTDSTNTEAFEGITSIIYVFDLRERETFIQLTWNNSPGFPQSFATAHVQIFDVNNNCNENNFFDNYTVNDTHVYNMRDIQTNDGNPSGVSLPENSYGIVVVTMLATDAQGFTSPAFPFGNLRILDNNGYEYRTNAQGPSSFAEFSEEQNNQFFYSFNFNQNSGITTSDIIGVTVVPTRQNPAFEPEWIAQPVQGIFSPFDVDIYDVNEVPFSCRDIIFSCVDEDNPLLEELLTIAGTANVASFEYGINEAIPHSRGGELLCPGNIIDEGTVLLKPEAYPSSEAFMNVFNFQNLQAITGPLYFGFVGLNNGNGRGSMDSLWVFNLDIFGGFP